VIKDIVEYIVTPDDIRGRSLSYGELRDAIARASREVAGLELDPSPFSEAESGIVDQFVESVTSDEFIRRISSERFRAEAPPGTRVGFANVKGKKLVRAGVALGQGDTIVRSMVAGDMHVSPPEAIDNVAAALVGANASDGEDLLARIRGVFEGVVQADAAAGITPNDIAEAVLKAAKKATG
ncbi:MAG: hypothetical protein ACRDKS_00880, partial [Actinomycetota bacterium]